MIKLEKTTKTNLKAKGLQMVNGQITDVETGEIISVPALVQNAFGTDTLFDFTFTTSVKEESEVETSEPDEFDPDDEAMAYTE